MAGRPPATSLLRASTRPSTALVLKPPPVSTRKPSTLPVTSNSSSTLIPLHSSQFAQNSPIPPAPANPQFFTKFNCSLILHQPCPPFAPAYSLSGSVEPPFPNTSRSTKAQLKTEMAEEKKDKEVMENGVSEREALPKAIVRRVVKEKLSQLSANSEISVLRDSLLAFSESARIFIHYLSATANDMCKESNRQIINAEDVFKALEEREFPEFIGPLRASLEEFRQRNAQRKSASSKDAGKKSAWPKDAGKESPSPKDAGKKSPPSKAKSTRKKAKRKEPSAQREGRKKRRVDESDGDKVSD